jgi:hypothetical protein
MSRAFSSRKNKRWAKKPHRMITPKIKQSVSQPVKVERTSAALSCSELEFRLLVMYFYSVAQIASHAI